ncbi:MAG: FkbM family methyltransferase, partial [Candidatus Lokiarchaeota archaeon]|nr:FkbM family methyltransferase [Candidatus Lokiarchaeota archaeon]
NIGIYTLLPLTKKGVRVYSFEPSPTNIKRQIKNIKLNKFENRVNIEQVAISNKNDIVNLYIDDSQRKNRLEFHKEFSPSDIIKVRSIKLDDYCKNNNVLPDFVKIDVEGVANKVFEGSTSLIQSLCSKWLLEIHNEKEKKAFLKYFYNTKYSLFDIDNRHVLAIPKKLNSD